MSFPYDSQTTSFMYELGESNTRYLINEVISPTTNTLEFLILVKDQLKNGGTQ